jgi:hypothetical protein
MKVTVEGKPFYGYVHDVKGIQDSNQNLTEVGFIGASYVMRQGSQKIYKDMTADQVVVAIARKYNFAYKVTPHPRVYPQISQAGLSDWELMVRLAKQSGYFLRAENTTLYFQPLLQDFKERISEAKLFVKNDAGFKSHSPLYSFRPIVGETLAHHGSDKSAISVAGIDPRTGEYFKYTKQRRSETTRNISHPELFDKHATHVVANGYTTAVSEANSADDKSIFPYSAEVEVMGVADLRPGMPVYLDNVGQEYSGYWTILSIQHEVVEENLNNQLYTTVMTVGSDSLGSVDANKYPKKPSGLRARKIDPSIRNTKITPGTVIRTPSQGISSVKTTSLVSRTNRASLKGQMVSTATWVSTHGNIADTPREISRSSAALKKMSNHDLRT